VERFIRQQVILVTRHCDDYDDYDDDFLLNEEDDEFLDDDVEEGCESKQEKSPSFFSWAMAVIVGPYFGDDL